MKFQLYFSARRDINSIDNFAKTPHPLILDKNIIVRK